MDYPNFASQIKYIFIVVEEDLIKLEDCANKGSASTTSTTTTFESTKNPSDYESSQDTEVYVSRCTVPLAMVCFSVIDMIGQWLNEYHDDDFGNSAEAFFSQLANRQELKNRDSREKLKVYFRHGIMHSFFSKSGYDVTYPEYECNTLFLTYKNTGGTLNVRFLSKIVRSGINTLLEKIMDEHDSISIHAFEGFKRWKKKQ